jgi:LacI family transcriptional regulator
MACNDLRGMQVIRATREAGLLIPEEVAILGAGNDTMRTGISHSPLSSVPINTDKWGFNAAETLHRLMTGKSTEKTILIEPREIVVRRSTDGFAIEEETTAEALSVIRTESSTQLTVDDLAKRVGISRSLMERRFRKYLRKSPQEIIRQEKINQIKELLISTDKSLAEIAEELGFSHSEYVSVIFKRLTGETTRSFRSRHRKLS